MVVALEHFYEEIEHAEVDRKLSIDFLHKILFLGGRDVELVGVRI